MFSTKFEGLNSILIGLVNDLSWKFGSFDNQLQNNLFAILNSKGITESAVDLLATNINRGRDHGLPPYVNYVHNCFNKSIHEFQDLKFLMNAASIKALQSVYE